MARLARLKFSMTFSILLVSVIFAVFLGVIMFVLRLPIVISFGATIIFLLFQYLIGPAIVRGSTHLRYLRPDENPWLESTVQELAQKGDVPIPRLAVVPDQTPNAFVFGRSANSSTLAVHEGLLRQLNKDEVKAVIGHELGHIKHKDYIVMTVLAALPLLAFWVSWITFEGARWTRSSREEKGGGLKAALFIVAAISYIVYIITLICVMGLSRLREHYADSYSAYLTGQPYQLQSALTKITYGLSLSPKPTTGARTFYIGDPAMAKQECQGLIDRKSEYDLDRDGVLDERELQLAMEKEATSKWTTINSWFSTHPPTFKRIFLLREIEEEMRSGRYSRSQIYANI